MEERDPLIGRELGAYKIQRKLGEGGMASVYKAYHARLRRDVAIKVILAEIAGREDFRARFEREAQLVASLEHPNIVAVYDFGEEGVIPYLVMQYVGGGTLRDQLQDGYPLASQQAAYYTLQMARALHAAHLQGIVHRDVKPQNMLVSAHNRNQLLLSDFGIAKLFDSSHDITRSGKAIGNNYNNNGRTSADLLLGTLEYMAPEQINRQEIDARTDVYALGVVLFQMLTGRVPFLSTTVTGLMYQHVHTPPPKVRELNPAVPDILAQITLTALEKAPERRFQSAEAMAQALENMLQNADINSTQRFTNDLPPSIVQNYSGRPLEDHNEMRTAPGMRSHKLPLVPSAQSAPGSADSQQFSRSIQGQNTGPTLGNRNIGRTTTAAGRQTIHSVPPVTHTGKPISMQMIVGIAILIIALALLIMRFQFFAGTGPSSNTQIISPATALTETFANNNAGWIEGNNNGLMSSVDNGKYTLRVTPGNTYFPYPTRIGTLPRNFTLSAQIRQDAGSINDAYGIVFYLNAQNSETKSGYAFVITSSGAYELLRYDGNNTYQSLWSATHSTAIHSIHQSNTLQAIVRNGIFSFKINGQMVPLKEGTSLKDTTYETGQPGLLVAGPDAQFTATKVQLAIP